MILLSWIRIRSMRIQITNVNTCYSLGIPDPGKAFNLSAKDEARGYLQRHGDKEQKVYIFPLTN